MASSFFVAAEVAQPPTDRPILGLSAPYPVAQIAMPHNGGHYVKLVLFPQVSGLRACQAISKALDSHRPWPFRG